MDGIRIKRIDSVQVLRGIAAMLVVFNHAALMAFDAEGHSFLVPSQSLADFGEFGVDLFFVISGFVMALGAHRFAGPRDAVVFLALRINRIAPLYYLACLVLLAQMFVTGTVSQVSRESLLNSLTFIPFFDDRTYSWPIHFLGWTLAFEFVFYVFVVAQIAFRLGAKPLFLLAAVALTPFLNNFAGGERVVWHLFTNPLLWEFALGVMAYVFWDSRLFERLRWLGPVYFGLAIVILAVEGLGPGRGWFFLADDPIHDGDSAARVLSWGVPAFLFFCFTLTRRSLGVGRLSAIGKRLGDASYSLYLSHLFVMIVIGKTAEILALPPDAVLILAVLAASVTGVLVHALVERPLFEAGQRAIRGWKYGRPSGESAVAVSPRP